MIRDVDVLYEATVLDHAKQPRNRGALDAAVRAERRNPMCGDRVVVYARVDGDVIREVSFEASACAIVVAAASLMTDAVRGRTLEEAAIVAESLHRMMTESGGGGFDHLGPLTSLVGVKRFPIRVKCAWLPWQALLDVMESARVRSR